jgi:HlyD family secretion protein
VGKVRLNATMTQNVVTYTVEIITDNSSGKLLPYLTANAQFELSRSDNVLLVPNQALRWSPQPEQILPEVRATVDSQASSGSSSNRPHRSKDPNAPAGAKKNEGIVWVQDGGFVRPIKVGVGLTDGTMTEVQGSKLKEGLEVIIGQQQQAADNGTKNPFAVQLPQRNRQPAGGQPRQQ